MEGSIFPTILQMLHLLIGHRNKSLGIDRTEMVLMQHAFPVIGSERASKPGVRGELAEFVH